MLRFVVITLLKMYLDIDFVRQIFLLDLDLFLLLLRQFFLFRQIGLVKLERVCKLFLLPFGFLPICTIVAYIVSAWPTMVDEFAMLNTACSAFITIHTSMLWVLRWHARHFDHTSATFSTS